MRCLLCAVGLWLSSFHAIAQMVRSDSLSQDPTHAQLCAAKVKIGSYQIHGKTGLYRITGTSVPFQVSADLAEQARIDGDALVVLSNGIDAWLVECYFGRLGNQPASVSIIYPEKEIFPSGVSFTRWGLVSKPSSTDRIVTHGLTQKDLDTMNGPIMKLGGAPEPEIDVGKLKYERQHWIRVLKAADDMQHARSYAERIRIFCRSQAIAFPALPWLGSVEDLEVSYAELERNEPPTREQETERQFTLSVWGDRLAQAESNMQWCIGGWQDVPTDEEERAGAIKARAHIAEIDRQLAAAK